MFSTSERLELSKVVKLFLILLPRLQVRVIQLSPAARWPLD